MKSIDKKLPGLLLCMCLIIVFASNANAQRGGFVARGRVLNGYSGPHVGFGFGGPRFGIGIGLIPPYYDGVFIDALPYGNYPFTFGPDQYYYYDGRFFRPAGSGYEITAPPIGAAVPQLPSNVSSIVIDEQQYFERRGVYFKQAADEKGNKIFIVVGKDGLLNTGIEYKPAVAEAQTPKVGDIVSELPEGCRKINLNGKKYHVSPDDIYYEEFIDANQNISYRIASVPDMVEVALKP